MKTEKIRELTEAELEKKLSDAKQELFNLKVQDNLGQIEKPDQITKVKKDIARMLTIKKEITKTQQEKETADSAKKKG
ncbi:MAG: 50S ribosomal protein L29 [Candidatus Auribacterota bacterium]|nr:50S ribosomal protein L29 [Candidatus Auribacterota bacterium]